MIDTLCINHELRNQETDMKDLTFKTTLHALALGLLLGGPVQAAGDAAHDHAHHAHDHAHDAVDRTGLVLNEGERWATDAALREGMERVRASFVATLPAYKRGELTAETADATAQAMDEHVAFMIQNCKLEADADAVLHVLLAELLQGSAALREAARSDEGMPRIHRALRDYGHYFEHPGWQAP